MALCGFDEQMLEGLKKFHNGIVEIILKRDDLKNPIKYSQKKM
jgi:hypothetical protein